MELFAEEDKISVQAAIKQAFRTGKLTQEVARPCHMRAATDFIVIPAVSSLCIVVLGPCPISLDRSAPGLPTPRSVSKRSISGIVPSRRTGSDGLVPCSEAGKPTSFSEQRKDSPGKLTSGCRRSPSPQSEGPPGVNPPVENPTPSQGAMNLNLSLRAVEEEAVQKASESESNDLNPQANSLMDLPGQLVRQNSEDGPGDFLPAVERNESSELSFHISSSQDLPLVRSVESVVTAPKDVEVQTEPCEVKECIKCRNSAKPPPAPGSREMAWAAARVQRRGSQERSLRRKSLLDGHWTLIAAQRESRTRSIVRLKIIGRSCQDFKGRQWTLDMDGEKVMLFDSTLLLEGFNLLHVVSDKEDLIYVRGDAGVDWNAESQRSRSHSFGHRMEKAAAEPMGSKGRASSVPGRPSGSFADDKALFGGSGTEPPSFWP